jgi:carboxyl-terminal processing protease
MLESLDAHSRFLDAQDFSDLTGTGGETGGIGLELQSAADGARIVGPLEGTPAASAEIAAGDLLIAIDDVGLKGLALNEIIRRLRGAPGSSVTITLQRAWSPALLRLILIRRVIRVNSSDGRILQGFLYLKISRLGSSVPTEMAETIVRLRRENEGAFRGIVLDLRACPGGLLQGAIAAAAAFLPPGTLVTATKGKTEESNRRYSADRRDYWQGAGADPFADLPAELKSAPMVVLIGAKTASGCEIVASALQDHKRAVVTGERSFGNGLIQTIIPLRSVKLTALRLATARIYRPNGELLDGKGVEPDVLVLEPAKPNGETTNSAAARTGRLGPMDDPLVLRALKTLESDSLLNH